MDQLKALLNLLNPPFHYSSPSDCLAPFSSPTSFDFSSPDSPHRTMNNSFSPENSDMFIPLYDGSSVTLCGAVCAIMHFCAVSKLSYVAIERLLRLLEVICPSLNCLPKSVYTLKKFFKKYNLEYSHIEYSSECSELIDNCSCSADTKTTCHLVHAPIKKSLEVIVSSKL